LDCPAAVSGGTNRAAGRGVISKQNQDDLLTSLAQGLLKKADLVIHSDDLFGKNGLVLIQHGSEWYQLKKTRQNRLILNK